MPQPTRLNAADTKQSRASDKQVTRNNGARIRALPPALEQLCSDRCNVNLFLRMASGFLPSQTSCLPEPLSRPHAMSLLMQDIEALQPEGRAMVLAALVEMYKLRAQVAQDKHHATTTCSFCGKERGTQLRSCTRCKSVDLNYHSIPPSLTPRLTCFQSGEIL